MIKATKMIFLAGATLCMGPAFAHPVGVPYETRGECERAAAASAHEDRERLVDAGIFPTIGATQSTLHDDWRCEYDEEEDAWYIVDYRGR